MTPEPLPAMLRRLRASRGWSQSRVATSLCEVSGHPTVTRNDVSRWERGKRVPRFWLPYLARIFGVPRERLELATVADPGPEAPGKARALFHDRAAWSHTKVGDAQAAMRSLEAAHEALADGNGRAPDWAYWVTADELEVMDARVASHVVALSGDVASARASERVRVVLSRLSEYRGVPEVRDVLEAVR